MNMDNGKNRCLENLPVNWHLLWKCNYKCIFCFNPKDKSAFGGQLPLCNNIEASTDLIMGLAERGASKLTFVGGEPLLCKNLGSLLTIAKNQGLTTMVVTNGYILARSKGIRFLEDYGSYIDWIGLSVDSTDSRIEAKLGRGFGKHVEDILKASRNIRKYASHIKIKLNTVVTKLTWMDDMSKLLDEIKPDRWKVFELKIVENANKKAEVTDLIPTREMLKSFVNRHKKYNPVIETSDNMTLSYLMVFPDGKFYIDKPGKGYEPIGSVNEICNKPIISKIKHRIKSRGGLYSWKTVYTRKILTIT